MFQTLLIKDGNGNFQNIGMINAGPSGTAEYLPISVPHDITGTPLFTQTNPGAVGELDLVVGASVTRPANTTPYVSGQLIAASTVASSVVPLAIPVARVLGGHARCTRARLTKSTTVTTNAMFRAHLLKAIPATISGGDGATLQISGALSYLGSFTFDFTGGTARTFFTDGAKVISAPDVGSEQIMETQASTNNIYALLEARGAYTPGSAEVFTLALEIKQD